MFMTIQILDCTLRDGGYVNEWNFGEKNIQEIVANLTASKVDYIELGFMKNKIYDKNKTLFDSIDKFERFIPQNKNKTKFYGMVAFGDFELNQIGNKTSRSIDGIRVIFKKKQIKEALQYCEEIKKKGYELFINPTFTDQYSDEEMLNLIADVNKIHPTGFSIVDTMGVMNSYDLTRLYMLVNHNLLPDIKVCFHSHNNLQQSFMDAVTLIQNHKSRDIIIDVSVMGMGRGAGNLNAELMISYLNENYGTQYDILPILKICDEHLSKIYAQKPWGYSMPYFLAASHKCHPNYSSYLIDKQTISIEAINSILLRIPDNKKAVYDENLIKQLYLDYQENVVDDSDVIEDLRQKIGSKSVLVIAPGKTIKENRSEIDNFILSKKPFLVSLNFTPTDYKTDLTFVSNAKRYEEQKEKSNLLITSNIKVSGVSTLNYASYLNNSEMYDNGALMFCVVLMKLGIKQVYFAGMDGFTSNAENYFSKEMINNAKLGEFDKRNEIMKSVLKKFSKQLEIHFITPSLYE